MSLHLEDVEQGSYNNPTGGGSGTRSGSDIIMGDQLLQRFLSQVGVVNTNTRSATGSRMEMVHKDEENDGNSETSDNELQEEEEDTIFESVFDLTEERLSYVFQQFDTDRDGKISYESLRRGLEFHTGLSSSTSSRSSKKQQQQQLSLDDGTFQELVRLLDSDGSGDISYPEFSEGIRLLMMRALFSQSQREHESFEVLDYDANRLERQVVVSDDDGGPLVGVGGVRNTNDSSRLAPKDFYFKRRPDWVKTRWIHVGASASAASTLQCLAMKYLLHPLALEDALSPETHRPKAESFSNHYFLMVPIFSLYKQAKEQSTRSRESVRDVLSGRLQTVWQPLLCCWFGSRRADHVRRRNMMKRRPPISRIRVQMVSIFVNVPKNDTIITFNNSNANDYEGTRSGPQDHLRWNRVRRELEKSYSKLRQYDAQYVTYALLDQAVDMLIPIVNTIRSELAEERELLQNEGFDELGRVHAMRKELEKVAQKLKPFMRLLAHVIEDDAIVTGATIYLRDVEDNLECVDEDIRQLIADFEALDAEADKIQSRRMDRTLYTLTVVSAVFLPAQFLTGVYGMNFQHMPELDERWSYPLFWAITATLVITLLWAFNCGRVRV